MPESATENDFDLSQLSPTQQSAFQQYTDVTSQDHKEARALLERSQWNVQIAITKFLDGEGLHTSSDATGFGDNYDIPRVASRFESLQDSFTDMDENLVSPPKLTEIAPRVVPRLGSTQDAPPILKAIIVPFLLGYRFAKFLVHCGLWVLSFLPEPIRPRPPTPTTKNGWKSTDGRETLMPQNTAARFKREFEEEYGEHSLPFFEGGHAQAMDSAKRDIKFLLIILLCPEHDDTDSFTTQTLFSPEVGSFIKDPANNLVLWGGNVLDSEAYQVSLEYYCTKFPATILASITPSEGSSTRMGIVKRLMGPILPAAYLSALQGSISRYAPDLDSIRAERVAVEAIRNLRAEQDAAYQRSLAIDLEKARNRCEAKTAIAASEKKAQEEAAEAERLEQIRQNWRKWRATTIATEPNTRDAVRLALNMPESSGLGRVVRKFSKEATLEELYAYVECYDLLTDADGPIKTPKPKDYQHKYTFRISSVMPRETLHPSEQMTVAEKLGRGGSLIVEDMPHDESDYGE